MKRNLYLAIGLSFLLFVGCSPKPAATGPTITPITQSTALVSAELKSRSVYHDASILQYNLPSLAGYILERKSSDAVWERKHPCHPVSWAATPPIPKLTEDGVVYSSIVDRKIAFDGNVSIPILSVAASLAENMKMEIRIEDQALLLINEQDIPMDKILNYINTAGDLPRGASRVWVQAVMLTRAYYKKSTEITSDQTVSGSVFKVGGKYYNSDVTSQRDSYLTMLLVDLDGIKKAKIVEGEYGNGRRPPLKYKAIQMEKDKLVVPN